MKKIKLYIASSIDGYIARPDGNLDWLIGYPNPEKSDFGYNDFLNTIDTVVMGGKTYRDILCMDAVWPYKDQTTFVISRHSEKDKENIKFINQDMVETIAALQSKEGKDIWLVGGGEINSMLLNEEMVDEMIISYIPVILGRGIRMFPNIIKESNWQTIDTTQFSNGIIQTTHRIIRK